MRNPLNKQYKFTSGFGPRILMGKPCMHYGVDLVPLDGIHPTELFATVSGTVADVRSTIPDSHTGLGVTTMVTGNYANIKTENGYTVIFRHMKADSVFLEVGQPINVGDKVGIMGSTGQSSGVHLHYEIRDPQGMAIDPVPYLDNDKQLGDTAPSIKVGDKVRINSGAMYYTTGEPIPAWVKGNIYTILQISSASDKTLLEEIFSWVRMEDITISN